LLKSQKGKGWRKNKKFFITPQGGNPEFPLGIADYSPGWFEQAHEVGENLLRFFTER
jgi:hypothetical protein